MRHCTNNELKRSISGGNGAAQHFDGRRFICTNTHDIIYQVTSASIRFLIDVDRSTAPNRTFCELIKLFVDEGVHSTLGDNTFVLK